MIRQNFTQLISTIGQTLTNSDKDSNNKYLTSYGRTGLDTVVLYGLIGVGSPDDSIDITVNGTRFEIACGNQINMPIESITLNKTTSAPLNPASSFGRNISTGTTANTLNYIVTNPGVLVYGYAINKTLF